MAASGTRIATLIVGGVLLCGCAARSSDAKSQRGEQTPSILVSSSPATGAIVSAPVDSLELHFNPPARLDEIMINGPNGLMPTMVHAVGEVADYSIPLSGLGPGSYTVNWRAMSQGRGFRGTYSFTVR